MRTNEKRLIIRTLFIALTACILFTAHLTYAATFAEETLELITQQMTAKIDGNMQKILADQTISQKMQKSMMTKTSGMIKETTAQRKRATVVKTCMECRSGKPLKIEITGLTTIQDTGTRTLIKQKMADIMLETIREKSSDPVVARSVQKRMMDERMPKSILQANMQPYMMGVILDSTRGNIADKKRADSVAQVTRDTLLLTMKKN